MDLQPKTEPGFPPIFDPNGHGDLKKVTVSEVVSVLRAEVDRVEEVLVARDAQHKAEIGPLQEKYEVERLMRLQAEAELKRKEEQCQALRNKNSELEREKFELMGLKRKRVDDDSNVVAELRIRVAAMENEKLELEDANKRNLATIEKLSAENRKLARDEKKKKKKGDEELLGNVFASVAGNTEGEPQAPLQRNIGVGHTLGASAAGSLVMEEGSSEGKRNEGSVIPMAMESELYRLDAVDHIAGRLAVQDTRILKSRQYNLMVAPDPRMEPFLRQVGLWHVAQMVSVFDYDRALISALVERWRPETHTFHLPYGECTITLQDVVFQLGLRVDGLPVSGCIGAWEKFYERDIWSMCTDLLGAVPEEKDIKGFSVNLHWFTDTFGSLPRNADLQTIIRYTRAFIMVLFGGLLFPDKSGCRVHMKWLPLLIDFDETANYSWGSAVLGSVYRELCRAVKYNVTEIAGCLALIQSWAWYRMPQLSPKQHHALIFPLALRWSRFRSSTRSDTARLLHYRKGIDAIGITGFRWTPYTCDEVRDVTPPFVYEETDVWASATALIQFAVIEWHPADRVVRQFGGGQHIPSIPINIDRLHAKDGRGDLDIWWPKYHVTWHAAWDARRERGIQYLLSDDDRPSIEYFQWYLSIANRFLSADGAPADPELRDLPDSVPVQAPPAPSILHPADVPDRRSLRCRVRVGTRASRRQYPKDVSSDDEGGLDDYVQPQPEATHQPQPGRRHQPHPERSRQT